MANLLAYEEEWLLPPQEIIPIDWENPITKDLALVYVPAVGDVNLAAKSPKKLTRVGTTLQVQGSKYGPSLNSTGDGVADRIDLGSITSSDLLSGVPTGELTVISRVSLASGAVTSIAPRLIDKSNGGTGAGGWWFGLNASNISNFQVNSGAGYLGTTALTANTWSTIGVSHKSGGSGTKFYLNGKDDTSTGGTDAFSTTTTNAAIGNWNHTTDRQWWGLINYEFVWGRELTADEHLSITLAPWQIFPPEFWPLFWTSAGGGGQTLTPSLFTDGDTFYSPTVTPGAVTLSPSLYTNTNTFYSPVVSSTYALTAPLVTDGDTFYGPTVTAAYTLQPSLYSDADTFYSPTVVGNQTISPDLFVNTNTFYSPTITGGAIAVQVGGGGGHAAKKRKYKTKKEKVWLVEVDDQEYEVDDLEEVKPIVAKKLAKGKKPEVKAKPLTENPREAATAYTQQAWLTEYVPIPSYEKRMGFVDVLPYILAMQEMEDEEEFLLMLAA